MEATQDNKLSHQCDDEPPSPPPPPPPPPPAAQVNDAPRYDNLLVPLYLGISFLVFGYRSRSDPWMLTFVLFSCSDLLLLFICLRRFERLALDSPPEERRRLKAAVWVLSTALILAFSCRVSKVMPGALAALIWVMAGSVTVGGFYGLFLHKEQAAR